MSVLNKPEFAALSSRRRTIPPGEFVFVEGQHGDAVFVVLSGEAEVTLTDFAGKQVVIRRLKPGEIFGELELLGPDSRRTGSVSSEGGCELIVIDRADVEKYLEETPPFLRYMIAHLCGIIKGWTDQARRPL